MENNKITNNPYLILFSPPEGWSGKHEFDMPESGAICEVITDPIHHVESFIYHFNANSLDKHKFHVWSGLTRDLPVPGAVVKILQIRAEDW